MLQLASEIYLYSYSAGTAAALVLLLLHGTAYLLPGPRGNLHYILLSC